MRNPVTEPSAAATSTSPVTPSAAAAPSNGLKSEAIAHLKAGRDRLALDAFAKLLKAVPDDPDALFVIGMLYARAGRHGAAIDMYDRALAPLGAVAQSTGQYGNLLAAIRSLVQCLMTAGDFDRVTATLGRASELVADSADARHGLGGLNFEVAMAFQAKGDPKRAIDAYRAVRALCPREQGARVNLSNLLAATQMPAELTDFTDEVSVSELTPYLFIACMPKSGSSFLRTALYALTGYAEAPLTFAYLQNEQELYLPSLVDAARVPTITQQHTRATEPNLQLMQGFGIRPVVLVRDLADVAVSLVDFYDGGADLNTFFHPFWKQLSRSERIDAVIDLMMPWYLSFYASWVRAERLGRVDVKWLTYREMIEDKPSVLTDIARFYGIEKDTSELTAAVEAADGNRQATRFNRGVVGRGRDELSAVQRERITRQAAHYRDVDFGRVGF